MSDTVRLSADAAEDLWRAWQDDRDVRARDRLVLSYAPMVKYLATRKLRGAPAHVSLDDLVAAGLLRLVQAVDGFDPALGATFEQYAWTRVAGGVLDELRKADWAPRSVRRRLREIEAARGPLERKLGRPAGNAEIAWQIGIPVEDVQDALEAAQRADVSSLNSTINDGEDGGVEVIETVGDPGRSPEQEMMAQERASVIREALSALTEREQLIVQMVFVEGRSAREASAVIGVSESRISQVTNQIRSKLAAHLGFYDAQAA
jgi:RNA polymerase sigma factor FliA